MIRSGRHLIRLDPPDKGNWARVLAAERGWRKVIPAPGSSRVFVEGIGALEAVLSDREGMRIWSISPRSDRTFYAVGGSTLAGECVLAEYSLASMKAGLLQLIAIHLRTSQLTPFVIVQHHPAFPDLVVLFDQASHALHYFRPEHQRLDVVLGPESSPELMTMNYLWLAASSPFGASGQRNLLIVFEPLIPHRSGPPTPRRPSPYGELVDTAADGKIDRLDFHWMDA
jgi:hypothetical protein